MPGRVRSGSWHKNWASAPEQSAVIWALFARRVLRFKSGWANAVASGGELRPCWAEGGRRTRAVGAARGRLLAAANSSGRGLDCCPTTARGPGRERPRVLPTQLLSKRAAGPAAHQGRLSFAPAKKRRLHPYRPSLTHTRHRGRQLRKQARTLARPIPRPPRGWYTRWKDPRHASPADHRRNGGPGRFGQRGPCFDHGRQVGVQLGFPRSKCAGFCAIGSRRIAVSHVLERTSGIQFESVWERRLYEACVAAGLSPRTQYPLVGYRLDLAFPEARLDVEVDGERFHRDSGGRGKAEDLWRDMTVRAAGWRPLRFWVYELREDLAGCVQRIREELERTSRPPAVLNNHTKRV